MRGCKPNVARALGYISAPGVEDRQYVSPVTIMGPMTGNIRSYHAGGMSSKDEYLRARRHAKCVLSEFRL